MRLLADRTTLVVVGAFNPEMLTPKWVAVHGLGRAPTDEFEVEIMAPVNGAGPSRYSFDFMSYMAGYRNLTTFLQTAPASAPDQAVTAIATILNGISYTPISGFGFNFSFSVADPHNALRDLVAGNNQLLEAFENESEIVAKRWGHTLKWNNALVNVNAEVAGDVGSLSFNFHYSVESAVQAENILRTQSIFQNHKDKAIQAASLLTNQQLEE